jgi:hypothetical protein
LTPKLALSMLRLESFQLCEGHMPTQTAVDVSRWEAELRDDRRLSGNARKIAHCLAEHFRANGGQVQLSLEHIADLTGIISLTSVRHSLATLKLTGWLGVERVKDTARKGLVYRPLIAVPKRKPVWPPSRQALDAAGR